MCVQKPCGKIGLSAINSYYLAAFVEVRDTGAGVASPEQANVVYAAAPVHERHVPNLLICGIGVTANQTGVTNPLRCSGQTGVAIPLRYSGKKCSRCISKIVQDVLRYRRRIRGQAVTLLKVVRNRLAGRTSSERSGDNAPEGKSFHKRIRLIQFGCFSITSGPAWNSTRRGFGRSQGTLANHGSWRRLYARDWACSKQLFGAARQVR